jgi:hypothetical protein
VLAPFLVDPIDVIAIPRLSLFFGTRFLRFGARAAAKACHEESKRPDNFQAGECVFHIVLVPPKMAQVPQLFTSSAHSVPLAIIRLITERCTSKNLIAITAAHYVDSPRQATSGLGALLKSPAHNIIELNDKPLTPDIARNFTTALSCDFAPP